MSLGRRGSGVRLRRPFDFFEDFLRRFCLLEPREEEVVGERLVLRLLERFAFEAEASRCLREELRSFGRPRLREGETVYPSGSFLLEVSPTLGAGQENLEKPWLQRLWEYQKTQKHLSQLARLLQEVHRLP